MNKWSKKISLELKIGAWMMTLYFLWAISWGVYSRFLAGEWNKPFSSPMNLSVELAKPFSEEFLLGADVMGRSLIHQISSGLLYSLGVAFIVTLLTSALGILIGYLAVKSRGILNFYCNLFINLIFIFPGILIAILIMAVSGASLKGLIFALVITGWPGYAKIARGESMRILNLAYVEGAKALGVSETRLFFKTVLPALLPVMIVNMIMGMSGVIVSEATLGFLGLGASPNSWGAMLLSAKTVLLEAPHVTIMISLVMAGLIIGLNLLGDGLRDYLDPHEAM